MRTNRERIEKLREDRMLDREDFRALLTGLSPEEEERLSAAIPRRIVYSVRSKSREILERLQKGPTTLQELYESCQSTSEIVATFLSMLELCSMGSVHIDREEDGYRLHFVGGDTEALLEKIEE